MWTKYEKKKRWLKKENVFKTSLLKCIEMQDLHEFFQFKG